MSKAKEKENKTDWEAVKWTELGCTKDSRCVLLSVLSVCCVVVYILYMCRPWTKKLSSWNVNGIRAWIKVSQNQVSSTCTCIDLSAKTGQT